MEFELIIIELAIIILTNMLWMYGMKKTNDAWQKAYIKMDEEWREVCRELNSEIVRRDIDG